MRGLSRSALSANTTENAGSNHEINLLIFVSPSGKSDLLKAESAAPLKIKPGRTALQSEESTVRIRVGSYEMS